MELWDGGTSCLSTCPQSFLIPGMPFFPPGARSGFKSLPTFPLGAGTARSSPGVDQAAAGPNNQGGCSSWEGLGAPAPPAGPTGQCEGRSLSPDPGEHLGRGMRSQEASGLYTLLLKGTCLQRLMGRQFLKIAPSQNFKPVILTVPKGEGQTAKKQQKLIQWFQRVNLIQTSQL